MKSLIISLKWRITYFNLLFLIGFLTCIWNNNVFSQLGLKGILDVDSTYTGWAGDPDTLKVYADSTFTPAQKDSIAAAVARWNAAGGEPAMVMSDDPDSEITVTTDDNLPDTTLGLNVTNINGAGEYTGSTISVNPDQTELSLKELVTHELGHSLGLNDTDSSNRSDVMKGSGPSNGSDGNLSPHDIAELERAGMIISTLYYAWSPVEPVQVGSMATIVFDLGQTYPPPVATQAVISVMPVMDPFIHPISSMVSENFLYVEAMFDPIHWSGMFFLNIEIIFPEPYPPVSFTGWHYAHISPVAPVTFTCPFDVNTENGITWVYWENQCTYPNSGPLRSTLLVDNSSNYFNRNGGPYMLYLEPGNHTLTLKVDDFQGNSATYTRDIIVTGTKKDLPGSLKIMNVAVEPNPFRSSCTIVCSPDAEISIFDLNGKLVDKLMPGNNIWTPGPEIKNGVYLIQVVSDSLNEKLKVVLKR